MWLHGVSIDWEAVHAGERLRRVPLPTYPFERQRYWVEEEPFHSRPGMKGAGRPAAIREKTGAVPGEQETDYQAVDAAVKDVDYEAPRDELEQDIAQLWQDFLGFERIGIHVDFFEINGLLHFGQK